jgi:hypothetical protein
MNLLYDNAFFVLLELRGQYITANINHGRAHAVQEPWDICHAQIFLSIILAISKSIHEIHASPVCHTDAYMSTTFQTPGHPASDH